MKLPELAKTECSGRKDGPVWWESRDNSRIWEVAMADGLFKGRTAVVTGGARGIGLACAAKIAAGGGRIALWDRDIERARKSASALKGAVAVEVDVTGAAS